jgi:F-type H+-transporting ATPase subunit beta
MATPGIVGERHYLLAQEIRRTLAQYGELKDIIAMLGLEQLSPEDRNVVVRARRLERFLTQPFFTTEQFTGLKGKLVSLKDALDGCERILRDEFKDYAESALYMIGAIGEVKAKPKPAQPPAPAKPGSKPESEGEPKPADEPKPETNREAEPNTQAEPRPQSGAEAKPKAELKPPAGSPAKAPPEPHRKPEAKPQPIVEYAAGPHAS